MWRYIKPWKYSPCVSSNRNCFLFFVFCFNHAGMIFSVLKSLWLAWLHFHAQQLMSQFEDNSRGDLFDSKARSHMFYDVQVPPSLGVIFPWIRNHLNVESVLSIQIGKLDFQDSSKSICEICFFLLVLASVFIRDQTAISAPVMWTSSVMVTESFASLVSI